MIKSAIDTYSSADRSMFFDPVDVFGFDTMHNGWAGAMLNTWMPSVRYPALRIDEITTKGNDPDAIEQICRIHRHNYPSLCRVPTQNPDPESPVDGEDFDHVPWYHPENPKTPQPFFNLTKEEVCFYLGWGLFYAGFTLGVLTSAGGALAGSAIAAGVPTFFKATGLAMKVSC